MADTLILDTLYLIFVGLSFLTFALTGESNDH